MDLTTLKKSASQMTDEELLAALSEVRSNRRRKVDPPKRGLAKDTWASETTVKTKVKKMDVSKKALLLAALKELKDE